MEALIATIFWQTNCPGAALASPQHDTCTRIGPWGGPLLMLLGLLTAAMLLVLIARRVAKPETRLAFVQLAVAALAVGVIAPLVSYSAITLPDDYCTPAQQRAEQQAEREWRANGRIGVRPHQCDAFEGDS